MPRLVRYATLLAFCLHGALILTAQYRLSYDAYNHMFFADHYLRDWWSLWEPRWYTGFEVTSYPPLVHQLIALFGSLIGVDAGFALVLWVVLSAYPLAVYAFSRIFAGQAVASYAAIGAALLPSLYLSAHTFGQLPTLAGTLLALLGAAALADFLRRGDRMTGALAVSLFVTVIAAHHATLLFLPWLVGAVFLHLFWREKAGRLVLLSRFVSFVIFTALFILAVIWPFWEWGSRQVMQTPIDHPSRHNFFKDPFAAVLFFLPVYGLLIPLIPAALRIGLQKRYRWPGLAFLFLFLLGLGGTTPLPRLFFGAAWNWLTYDRFALWASLMLLPLLGGVTALLLRRKWFQHTWKVHLVFMMLTCIITGLIPSWLPTQPAPLNMQPIVDFLNKRGDSRWRYVTFGFGDQLARLSLLTNATTIDGSYHTARTLPELRTSGIGQIDTAYWVPGGLSALDPILQKSGERGVRWGFVNLKLYVPVLERNGWVKLATLTNGVEVWENPSAVLPPSVPPPPESPFAAFSWGVFPLLALFVTGLLAVRRYWVTASARIFSAMQALAIGLLPLSLTLWYYRTLFVIEHPRIYFTYSDALFFLCDGLALVAVLTRFIRSLSVLEDKTGATPGMPHQFQKSFSRPDGWIFALCLVASLSAFWSLDWRTSLYISFHLWLCFTFYLLLRDTPQAWRWFALGCCAALVLQVGIGIGEFATQSTALIKPLKLDWPGELLPSVSGASIVQLVDGTRWLRAYGTLPHPNLLGGFVLALLAAPLALFLTPSKRRILPVVLFIAGLVLLLLTFSRSAWVGFAVGGAVLLFHLRRLERKHLVLLALAGLLTIALVVIPLRSLFFTRLGEAQVQTEQVSNYTRLWLIERTIELIQKHPLLGTGIGSYSLALSQHVEAFYKIEPVHNVLLLALSELGIAGVIVLGGLAVAVVVGTLKARSPAAIVLSATLMGLFAITLFDHYLWTLAPGRLLFISMLGLWAGQVRGDEYQA